MTLTRAKLLHAIGWGIMLLLMLIARSYGPIDSQPLLGIMIALVLVVFVGVILLDIGVGVEKPDERATGNFYKANSLLFNLIDVALVLYLVFGDDAPLTIPYEYILILIALINIIQDAAFLYYESRSE